MISTSGLSEQKLLEKCLQESDVVAIAGENFSGRTDLLRWATGLSSTHDRSKTEAENQKFSVYIGPDVYNDISALGSSVEEELRLHCIGSLEESSIMEIIKSLKLRNLYKRNPFTLSGGEQAILVITSKLALMPDLLGIDGALEQVDTGHRKFLLEWLARHRESNLKIIIADNFLDDLTNGKSAIKILQVHKKRNELFGLINSDVTLLPAITESPNLLIDKITFRYETWTQRFFNKLRQRFFLDNRFEVENGFNVLNEVSVELKPGQLYFLEGQNGAGKSTLAKILCGVLRPSNGRVFVNGQIAKLWKSPANIVGYHFQNPDVQLFTESVKEEILTRLKAKGMASSERESRYNSVISAFGLTNVQMEHPLDLPFVVRKRVTLACTVAMGRPWLILDEPTLGQDEASSDAIARIIEKLILLNIGVIVISHSTWLRRRLSSLANLLQLKNGQII